MRDLFHAIQPERVHPLINDQCRGYDAMAEIPEDILNEGCRVVENELDTSVDSDRPHDNDDAAEGTDGSFLDESELYSGELSEEISIFFSQNYTQSLNSRTR